MRSVREMPHDTLVVCPENIGGCGKRYKYIEVKHLEVPTKTVRLPATGELLVLHSEAKCPSCGTIPLIMPGGLYTA